jgi:head-tail adaptor
MYKDSFYADYPTIDPGSFRHQIILLSQTLGSDAGGSTFTYQVGVPPVTTWAKIDYLRGDELLKSGQDVSQSFLKVTAWYRAEFAAGSRIQAPSGSQFIIQNVENVKEMNMYMVLMCLGIGSNN